MYMFCSEKSKVFLLEDDNVKNTLQKELKNWEGKSKIVKHIQNVHEGVIRNVKPDCSKILSVKFQLYTIKVVKNSLTKLDRNWIGSEKGVGYGQLSIKTKEETYKFSKSG